MTNKRRSKKRTYKREDIYMPALSFKCPLYDTDTCVLCSQDLDVHRHGFIFENNNVIEPLCIKCHDKIRAEDRKLRFL